MLEALCVADDMDGVFADAGDAWCCVHDGGLFTTRQQPQRAGEQEDEQAMCKPLSYQVVLSGRPFSLH